MVDSGELQAYSEKQQEQKRLREHNRDGGSLESFEQKEKARENRQREYHARIEKLGKEGTLAAFRNRNAERERARWSRASTKQGEDGWVKDRVYRLQKHQTELGQSSGPQQTQLAPALTSLSGRLPLANRGDAPLARLPASEIDSSGPVMSQSPRNRALELQAARVQPAPEDPAEIAA